MSKREEFIAAVNILSAASQSITAEQRIGLLQQAVQQYGLSADDADEILKASGLVVGEKTNYFEVLGLPINDLQEQNEAIIASQVDEAHKKLYSESLRAGGLPRPDGKTQEQWRTVLNQARDTLKDAQKRAEHIATLQTEMVQPVDPIPQEELPTLDSEESPTSEQEEYPISEHISISVSALQDMELIPAGEFRMGNNTQRANDREKPEHTVYVDAFYMDKYPVTNAQYKTFIDANPKWSKPSELPWPNLTKLPDRDKNKMLSIFSIFHDGDYLKCWNGNDYPSGKEDHPVTYVSWYAAMAYAQWIGKRLPTEAEWEKAARGGLIGQKYPWGNNMDQKKAYNRKKIGETISVGEYTANNYGLYNMVGNAWEWCLDAYDADFYSVSPVRNPVAGVGTKEDLDTFILRFREIETDRVLRGGSVFTSSEPIHTAARWGGSPTLTSLLTLFSSRIVANIGFRCAWNTRIKS